MQQRQLFMLLGALGVLIGIAFLSGAFNNDFSEIDVPTFDIEADQIEKITISSENEPVIILVKQENSWAVTDPIEGPADSIALSRLSENLGDLELESVVSTNPDRYETYGVTEKAQQLTVTAGGKEQKLVIGNAGPDYRSIYLRMADDPRVFVTRGRLNAPPELDAWRDKTIIKLNPSVIEQVQVASPDESFTVRTVAGGPTIEINEQVMPADSAGVARWLDRFSSLKGLGFDSELTVQDLKSNATHVVTITSLGGAVRTFWLYDQENKLTGTTSEHSTNIFTLSKGMLSSYVPESSTLIQSN